MKLKPNEILVLRTCKPDGTSYNGFLYPKKGKVVAPDYEPHDNCGHGLHGLPWGVGAPSYLNWEGDNGWVLKVDTSKNYHHGTGDMKDNCKFKEGIVVIGGASREACIELIQQFAPKDARVNWAVQSGGDKSTQTAGDWSTQTAGDWSTQTAGSVSTQKAGDGSTQTAGGYSTQTAGDGSTQMAGYRSTQTAGDGSTQMAGEDSTQTAGDYSTQTAGNYSIQTAGVGTVQIIRYLKNLKYGKWKIKTRTITEKEAGKTYKFENGNWHLAPVV